MAFLGYLILFYGILTIESFNQKKSLLYKVYNKGTKSNLESKIEIGEVNTWLGSLKEDLELLVA